MENNKYIIIYTNNDNVRCLFCEEFVSYKQAMLTKQWLQTKFYGVEIYEKKD